MNKKIIVMIKKYGVLARLRSENSKPTTKNMKKAPSCLLKSAICILSIAITANAAERFFTQPDAPFSISAREEVVKVELPLAAASEWSFLDRMMGKEVRKVVPAETAQAAIDAARAANPEALLEIETQDPVEVGADPLRLGSKMRLLISRNGGIVASPESTASALIAIENSEDVFITSLEEGSGVVDGAGKSVTGISVTGGARINIDHIIIQGCGVVAIDYKGRDAAAFNEAVSVTRCLITGNADGLRVDQTAAFQCLDNNFSKNTATALTITSINSIVAGNQFEGNKAAIRSGSDRGVIARNKIADKAALELTAASKGNLVTENIGRAPNHQLVLAGSTQQLFRNDIAGSATLDAAAKDIFLIGNANLETDMSAPGLKFFNPTTYGHPHKDAVIVAGMGRYDLPVIKGGELKRKADQEVSPPVDIDIVQSALDQARAEHPNDVIVAELEGEFVSRTGRGLVLPPNTCFILKGRILAELGIPLEPPWEREAEQTQLVLLPATGFCSVSGGKLDAARQAFFPINAKTGSVAVIEGVSLASGAREGLNTKARTKDPLFIYRCNVYANGGRGIWAHVCSRVHSIANNCVANNMDGIDLDAGSIDGTALFNTCTGNRRHGVFIEEGIKHNIAFANTLNANRQAGVHVWNEAVKKNTGQNVVSANECNGNRRGVSVGGRASDITANVNFFFNNVCRENWLDGILTGNSHGKGNYFSQIVVGQNNDKDIVNPDSAAALFLSDVEGE
jgi:hypothetical protein